MNHTHPAAGDTPPCVRAAHDEERETALQIIFDGFSPVAAEQAGLWVAVRNEQVVAAAWIQRLTTEIAAVWPPASRNDPVAESLLASKLKDVCAESSFHLFRALIPVETVDRDAAALSAIGLERATSIVSLYCSTDGTIDDAQSQINFEPVNVSADAERLVTLTQATFEQSLDCPQLTRMTNARAILDGYIARPGFTPDLWFCLTPSTGDTEDAGILILSDNEEDEQLEVVYLGVKPSFRGRAYGAAAINQAKRLAAERGRRRLTLAVDIQNQPALDIYRAAGFTLYAEHELFVLAKRSA